MNNNQEDTICAIATAQGGAIGLIRVSGPQAIAYTSAIFNPIKSGKKLKDCLPYSLTYGHIIEGNETVDEVMVSLFKAPHSYTGEDSTEIACHGSSYILQKVIQMLIKQGCRLAQPGEYTQRAFLNGKMDLTQAESVADVIHSANRAELENAHRLLSGALSKKIAALTAQVKDISARLELDVDFAEEEADPDFAGWETRFVSIRETIQQILNSFRGKAALSRLPLAVLYGAPNAGKSSLVNALLGEDRVLVSNVPGTTRDFVEVRLFLDGGEIRLVDTAGIADKATDELDALSMKKSREILEEADLKILVLDGSDSSDPVVQPDFIVHSKCDLRDSLPETGLCISSKTGVGLAELKSVMNAALFKKNENQEDLWITSEREKTCLEEALAGVNRVLDLLKTNPAVELLAFEMQLVRRALQSITGEISSEDILQSIFAGFCIGK